MKEKYVLLSLMVVLCLAFSACGQASDSPTSGTQATTTAATQAAASDAPADTSADTADSAPAEPSETAETSVPAEPVVIWAPGDGGSVTDWDSDVILQEVEKQTNTDIEIVWMDWGTYADQLKASSAAREFPDIASCVSDWSFLYALAEGEMIAPFEGDVAAAAPNVLAQYDANESLNEIKIFDRIYIQPVSWDIGNNPNMGLLHVRGDLLEKFGLPQPETYAEYVEYLRHCVQEENMQGIVFEAANGIPESILNVFLGGYGLPFRGWVQKDSGYEHWSVQPEVATALYELVKLRQEGLIDPAVLEYDGDLARTAYVSGQAASYIFNGGGHTGRIQNDMLLVDPSYKEILLPALTFGGTERGYTEEDCFSSYTVLGSGEQNNPVAAARVVNYLISDEGYELTAIGIEDRDFTRTGSGITDVEWLDQRFLDGFPTEAGNAGAHPLASGIVSWQPQSWQDFTLLYGKDAAYLEWYAEQSANQSQYQIPSYGRNMTTPEFAEHAATGTDLLSRAMVDAYASETEEEVAAVWDAYVAEWLATGGDRATESMSALLSETY